MNGESIFDVIIQGYSSLTRSEIRVADYILKHKPELPYIMSKTLADACQVSEATITRFCRSVGCASFNDFKVRAAQAISSDSTSGPAIGYDLYGDIQLEDSLEQKCQKLYRVGTQALQQTLDLLDYGAVRKVVDCLYEADNVYCFGQGNTSIIAMDAWGRFSSITSKFHWINDFHMQAITAATLGAKDVILYFSFSGAMRAVSYTHLVDVQVHVVDRLHMVPDLVEKTAPNWEKGLHPPQLQQHFFLAHTASTSSLCPA